MQYGESASLGERLLEQALKALGSSLAEIDDANWERVNRETVGRTKQELLADIGLGKQLPAVVARRLLKRAETTQEVKGKAAQVVIRGTEGMAVQIATCCRPIPGDAIVGYLGRGEVLLVHTAECHVAKRLAERDPERWMDVEWAEEPTRSFETAVTLLVRNGKGVLAQVASAVSGAQADITHIDMGEDRAAETTELRLLITVRDRLHLADALRTIRRCPPVLRVWRIKP
jgi:GTP pyrophosphokinase/guanosine-3',5'-bis(diphosphate) 3'-pyrophosphohydrolase